MYIFNVYDDSSIINASIEALKLKGVKYKWPKRSKIQTCNAETGVFGIPLEHCPKVPAPLKNGQITAQVPAFLFEACYAIERNIHVEGIFRKAGSASKQKTLRTQINLTRNLPDSCHVIDVCNLVKMFLREMPDPLIPSSHHEIMLSCLLLPSEEDQIEALLLSCLLLSRERITTLSYLLEFLNKVAANSADNKMDMRNLAVVMTPSMMNMQPTQKRSVFNINHYIAIVELLIKCADQVGVVPSQVEEVAKNKKGRKRRSASITRVFTNIKKMVNRPNSPQEAKPGQKRKSQEILPPIEVKRRREIADTTPRMCRMRGYSAGSVHQSGDEEAHERSDDALAAVENETKVYQQYRGRRQAMKSKSASNLFASRKKIERKLSSIAWGKWVTNGKDEPIEEEMVTIPRKEYETLLQSKEVHNSQTHEDQLASRLEHGLNIAQTEENNSPADLNEKVEIAFKKVVEQSEKLTPQISKDIRIRWSTERIPRSPSERKIGSIRRRSRELVRSNSAAQSTSSGARSNSKNNSPRSLKASERQRNSKENWRPAVAVLASPSRLAHVRDSPKKRDSINCLRRNNLGMVQAKAKFFDSLNNSSDTYETDRSNESLERKLATVQMELRQMKPMKENRQPSIKAQLGVSSATLRTPRSCTRPAASRLRATPMRALPDPVTPLRRSPRILAKSLVH